MIIPSAEERKTLQACKHAMFPHKIRRHKPGRAFAVGKLVMSSDGEASAELGAQDEAVFLQGDAQDMPKVYLLLIAVPLVAILLLMSVMACIARRKREEPPFMRFLGMALDGTQTGIPTHRGVMLRELTMNDTFAAAENVAAMLRCRIQGTVMLVGWAVFALGILPHAMYLLAGLQIDEPYYSLLNALAPWGIALLHLALRPIDAALVSVVSYISFAIHFTSVSIMITFTIASPSDDDPVGTAFLIGIGCVNGVGAAVLAPSVVCCARAVSPRRKLQRLWLVHRLTMGGVGLLHLFLALSYLLHAAATPTEATMHCTITGCTHNASVAIDRMSVESDTIISVMLIGFFNVLGALVFAPRCRACVLRRIGSVGRYRSQYQEAAAVAALLNSRTSVVEAITIAKRVFRVLPLDRLTPADFATSTTLSDIGRSVESLFSRTRRADLGDCDAFVSHSWHDDATCKYARLKEHGWGTAEPTIWLDKVRAEPPLAITWLRAAATTPA